MCLRQGYGQRLRTMIKRTFLGADSLLMFVGYAAAATITVDPCDHLLKSVPNVADQRYCALALGAPILIKIIGRLEKGDLATLRQRYAEIAYFACLNRIEPDTYSLMSADQFTSWQKEWRRSHPSTKEQPDTASEATDTSAKAKCANENETNPTRPGRLNGMLAISSAGGDLNEAMAIGQWVRQHRIGVDAVNCASACVWVLASGFTRVVIPPTKLLVHRPYVTANTFGTGDTLRELLRKSKEYFATMGYLLSLPNECSRLRPMMQPS